MAALFAVVLVVACVQGPRAPEVAPTGVLGLRGTPSELDDAGPLKVVHASPQGKLDGPSEITILFSKPMRPLEIADEERPLGVSITPPIPGRWRWVGTRAATFVPEREGGGGSERLPQATRFEVVVPKGTKALDGEPLAEDFRFGFETERPSVVRTTPYQGSKRLEPDARFQLFLSAPVSDAEITRSVKLSASGAPVSFSVVRPDTTDAKRAQLVPTKPLPLDAAIRL
jgi:alpha-2-macroglobulin